MNNKSLLTIGLFFFLSLSYVSGQPQEVFVKDILKNPSAYMREDVIVSGLVIQYVEATEKTTSHYYLKDDYGAIIKIHTAEGRPETNAKYKVRGILYIDPTTQTAFISEKSKAKLSPALPPVVINPPQKTWLDKNGLLLIIGSSATFLLLLMVLYFTRRRVQPLPSIQQESKIPQPGFTPENTGVTRDNLKTMIIPSSVPKTMKFIPGEFEIISGDDKGKTIKIGGYPTEEGSIVTIGRDQITGPRDFAHIQLKERTISRRQAEIILKDSKLYIKNLSETNYTKLNGKDIPPNTSAEFAIGSVLTFGEVEMKYKV